jgi:hypothetical protein
MYLQVSEKQEQANLQISRGKELINITAEINKMETKMLEVSQSLISNYTTEP